MSAVLILVSEICWEIVCLKEKASQNILLSFTAPFCHLSFHFFFSLMLWWSLGRFYVWCHHVLKRLFVLDLMCRNMLKRNTVFINGSDKPFLWVKIISKDSSYPKFQMSSRFSERHSLLLGAGLCHSDMEGCPHPSSQARRRFPFHSILLWLI